MSEREHSVEGKACRACHVFLPLFAFHRKVGASDGLRGDCHACRSQYLAEWYARPENVAKRAVAYERKIARRAYDKSRHAAQHQGENLEANLRRTYGITGEDWARMFEAQKGRCLGCTRELDGGYHTHVDHDHATGKVRGLLCSGCNRALGGVEDSAETLKRLASYLERR